MVERVTLYFASTLAIRKMKGDTTTTTLLPAAHLTLAQTLQVEKFLLDQ